MALEYLQCETLYGNGWCRVSSGNTVATQLVYWGVGAAASSTTSGYWGKVSSQLNAFKVYKLRPHDQ